MNTKILTENSHIDKVLNVELTAVHSNRAKKMKYEIETMIDTFKQFWMVDYHSMKSLSDYLSKYFYY
jgi:hypothetical protein